MSQDPILPSISLPFTPPISSTTFPDVERTFAGMLFTYMEEAVNNFEMGKINQTRLHQYGNLVKWESRNDIYRPEYYRYSCGAWQQNDLVKRKTQI